MELLFPSVVVNWGQSAFIIFPGVFYKFIHAYTIDLPEEKKILEEKEFHGAFFVKASIWNQSTEGKCFSSKMERKLERGKKFGCSDSECLSVTNRAQDQGLFT